jgi:hypothetical protein
MNEEATPKNVEGLINKTSDKKRQPQNHTNLTAEGKGDVFGLSNI